MNKQIPAERRSDGIPGDTLPTKDCPERWSVQLRRDRDQVQEVNANLCNNV